jgi:DNA-binding NarL/FixJ family response regulator
MKKTFLVVDDQEIFRRGVVDIVEGYAPEVAVHQAHTGREAVEAMAENEYVLAVVDMKLADMSGVDLLKSIKRVKPEQAVLIMAAHSDEGYALRALRAGASGYLGKNARSGELLAAIDKILHGGKYVGEAFFDKLILDIGSAGGDSALHEFLSDREFRVFRELAGGRSIKEIAGELFLSVQTVSTYRSRVLKKMHMKSNADLVRYAINHGLSN